MKAKLLGREPTLWIAAVDSFIAIAGTLGLGLLSSGQAVLWIALVDCIAAAVNAWTVRPIAPTTFQYLIKALVALAAAYGFNIPIETVAAVSVGVLPFLALLSRAQVSPAPTSITRETTIAEKEIRET